MYAIVKTGGKQYKVAAGDILDIEKIDAEVGNKVALEAICVVDGASIEADPVKAAKTKVEATVIEQFKGEKQLVFKFKKRKNYKKMRGHRQNLTKVRISAVGAEKAPVAKAKPAAKKPATAKAAAEKPVTEKPAATKAPAKKPAAKKPATAKAAAKKPAAKKPAAKKAVSETADAE